MTLTEMIRAHDGGPISAQLRLAIQSRFAHQLISDFIEALEGDINAALRLPPHGWEWEGFNRVPIYDDPMPKPPVKWWVAGLRKVVGFVFSPDDKENFRHNGHPLITNAMAMAALQAHGVE